MNNEVVNNEVVSNVPIVPEVEKISLTLVKRQLYWALALVNCSMKPVNSGSVLNCCLLEKIGDDCFFKFTDLENFYTKKLVSSKGPDCKILISMKELHDVVKTLNKKQFVNSEGITFTTTRPEYVMLSLGETQIKEFHTSPVEDYPKFPDVKSLQTIFSCFQERFSDYVDTVKFASAEESSRYTLNGVHFKNRDLGVLMEATDGKRLSRREMQTGIESIDFDFILGKTALKLLDSVVTETLEFSAVLPVKLQFTEEFLTKSKEIDLLMLTEHQRDVFEAQTGMKFPVEGGKLETCKIGVRAGWRVGIPSWDKYEVVTYAWFNLDDFNNSLELSGESERYVVVRSADDDLFIFKKIEGRFPKADDVFPRGTPSFEVFFERASFLDMLETQSSFLDKKMDWRMVFEFTATELTVKVGSCAMESKVRGKIVKDKVPLTWLPNGYVKTQAFSGELKLMVDLDYVLDFLRAMKSSKSLSNETLNFEFRDEETAVIVKVGELKYLLMPISMKE